MSSDIFSQNLRTIEKAKLHLGCGNDILEDFLNVDVAPLPGVDLTCNLNQYPWPLPENHFQEILAVHLLEHLPDTIKAVEEIWRVAVDGAKVTIRVPYWNCWHAIGDPTHVKTFHQKSLNFFDPNKKYCQERPYYSKARFQIEKVYFWRPLFRERGWIRIGNPLVKALMSFLGMYLNNIIWVLDFQLKAIKRP